MIKQEGAKLLGRNCPLGGSHTRKSNGKYRSRLWAREMKTAKREDEKLDPADVSSSMPLVEGLKCLISHMMTEKVDADGEPLCMATCDVRARAPPRPM